MTRKQSRGRAPISAPTWTDEQGKTWLLLGEGALIDAIIPQFLAAFEDGEAVEDPIWGWRIRSDWLDKYGYMHLRIGVFVERI